MQADQNLLMSLEAAAQIFRYPLQLVQAATSLVFPSSICPTEKPTDDEPPDWKRRDERWTIDALLGSYDPSTKHITIFNKGIAHVAQQFGLPGEIVERIVRIHEWGHAIFHLGVDPGMSPALAQAALSNNNDLSQLYEQSVTARYNDVERYVHEQIAQAITLISLQDLASRATIPDAKAACTMLLEAFGTITRHQPREYRLEDLERLDSKQLRRRLRDLVALIKQGKLQGDEKAWQTLLQW